MVGLLGRIMIVAAHVRSWGSREYRKGLRFTSHYATLLAVKIPLTIGLLFLWYEHVTPVGQRMAQATAYAVVEQWRFWEAILEDFWKFLR